MELRAVRSAAFLAGSPVADGEPPSEKTTPQKPWPRVPVAASHTSTPDSKSAGADHLAVWRKTQRVNIAAMSESDGPQPAIAPSGSGPPHSEEKMSTGIKSRPRFCSSLQKDPPQP